MGTIIIPDNFNIEYLTGPEALILNESPHTVYDYTVNKFGNNSDIDTGGEDVWEGGGIYTGQPIGSPETVDIVSGDATDTNSGGTGARTLRIIGLASNTSTSYTSEDINLNGTTPVTSSGSWWRIVRAYVLTAGSNGENAGVITINHTTTTANIFAQIPIGANQTQIAAYTIPAIRTGILRMLDVGMGRANGAAGSAEVSLRVRNPGGVYRAGFRGTITDSFPLRISFPEGILLSAGTDIKVYVESVSDINTSVSANLEMIILKN